ncbi:LamG domain-containing protein [Solirubrobacter soli]|uniref:LamG domain-containing protein n=1 Tax=Solirubrobacter soli TaxID=363832 RepID=UPI00041630B5|nr:LamG domain-containing protein [Solirubrobacter soli]
MAGSLAVSAVLAAPSIASAADFPLRAWWPLYEGKGQTVGDWSGNKLNGYLGSTTGVDSNDPTWIKGIFGIGAGLRFTGDDFVTIPDSDKLEPQKLTVSMWFRGSSSPGTFKYLLAKGGNACTAASYGIQTGWHGGLDFYVWDGAHQYLSGAAPQTIWDGKWHNVAGTWDGTLSKLYIDGKLQPGGSSSSATIDYGLPSGNTTIGGYHAGCDLLFTGDIDQVMVWSDALDVSGIWSAFSSIFNRPSR